MSFKKSLRRMDSAIKNKFGEPALLDGVSCNPIIDEGIEIESEAGVIAIVDAASFHADEVSRISTGQVLVTDARSYEIGQILDKSGNFRRYQIL